jgi:hypothetical protein
MAVYNQHTIGYYFFYFFSNVVFVDKTKRNCLSVRRGGYSTEIIMEVCSDSYYRKHGHINPFTETQSAKGGTSIFTDPIAGIPRAEIILRTTRMRDTNLVVQVHIAIR